jgi:DNA repair protein RecO (recombination protein O)
MGLKRDAAFVLSAIPLKEKDRIVTFLTETGGTRRGVVRGARKLQSAFASALEPMSEIRIAYFENEGRELTRIDTIDLLRSSFPAATSLPRALLLSAVAETLATFVSDSDPSEKFFRLARHVMDAMIAGIPTRSIAAYVDVWVLRLTGILPSVRECASCGTILPPGEIFLDISADGFLCRSCARPGSSRLSPRFSGALDQMLHRSLSEIDLPTRSLDEIAAVAGRLRRRFLGHELKSKIVTGRLAARGAMLDSAP